MLTPAYPPHPSPSDESPMTPLFALRQACVHALLALFPTGLTFPQLRAYTELCQRLGPLPLQYPIVRLDAFHWELRGLLGVINTLVGQHTVTIVKNPDDDPESPTLFLASGPLAPPQKTIRQVLLEKLSPTAHHHLFITIQDIPVPFLSQVLLLAHLWDDLVLSQPTAGRDWTTLAAALRAPLAYLSPQHLATAWWLTYHLDLWPQCRPTDCTQLFHALFRHYPDLTHEWTSLLPAPEDQAIPIPDCLVVPQ